MYKVQAPPNLLILTPLKEPETMIYMGEKTDLPTQGTVVSVGAALDPNWLGLEVLFKKFGAQAFDYDGVKYLSIEEKEVVALLTEEK